jgi:hypothetical protein
MRRITKTTICVLLIFYQLVGCLEITNRKNDISACTNGASPINIAPGFQFPGTLLLYDTTQSLILSYDGKTHAFTTLMDLAEFENENVSSLSPGGQWLLVSKQSLGDPNIVALFPLFNTGQAESKKFPVPESDDHVLRYFRWTNDDSFLGWTQRNEFYSYGIFEPLVSQWHPLEFDSLTFYKGNRSGIAISPDLKRVLFVNSEFSLILFDLQSNQILWKNSEYDGINPVSSSPVLQPAIWSEDGSLLAVPTSRRVNDDGEHGILVLDKSGDIISSAHFENRPFGLNFSHSKKYLAFYEERPIQQSPAADRVPVISLMGTETGEVFDLCMLHQGTDPTHNIESQTILWSPDDAYLAYNYGDVPPQRNTENKNGIIIQKLDGDQIRLIPSGDSNLILLGWSSHPWNR